MSVGKDLDKESMYQAEAIAACVVKSVQQQSSASVSLHFTSHTCMVCCLCAVLSESM